eukprot:234762-Chlamydomonas_euryale.AAC.2
MKQRLRFGGRRCGSDRVLESQCIGSIDSGEGYEGCAALHGCATCMQTCASHNREAVLVGTVWAHWAFTRSNMRHSNKWVGVRAGGQAGRRAGRQAGVLRTINVLQLHWSNHPLRLVLCIGVDLVFRARHE